MTVYEQPGTPAWHLDAQEHGAPPWEREDGERCPKCGMKAHAPDQWCSTKIEEEVA